MYRMHLGELINLLATHFIKTVFIHCLASVHISESLTLLTMIGLFETITLFIDCSYSKALLVHG